MAGGKFILLLHILQLLSLLTFSPRPSSAEGTRSMIDLDGGPDSVAWVVQVSDLHFSVFHPERARHFNDLIGPTLSIVNPSLVLITGDLTDGKSKDLITMKSNEEEWVEYRNVMEETIRRSGLQKRIFYDLRGNHDKFGVSKIDSSYDFFKNYSINSGLNRKGNVHSVTLKNGKWKHLFVGFDATMDIGLRGPTNLFGHPSDDLLTSLDLELSQWDSLSDFKNSKLTKIAFGHFTISFSAPAESGRSLKDVFLNHSLSAYLCGHLHSRFGKNLKRRHVKSSDIFQLNIHQEGATATTPANSSSYKNCSAEYHFAEEFWEWEMGDWRKRRAFRIIAIDNGHVSYLDMDLKKKINTIILPLFPLDSRFTQRISSGRDYFCELPKKNSTYQTVRALVFSKIKINTVIVRMFDSSSGKLDLVMDSTMKNKQTGNQNRGNLYSTIWNWRAFSDPSPDRYWMQIEAVDVYGTSTFSEVRPFSINGLTSKVRWTWNEFRVMGIQWTPLYYIIIRATLLIMYSLVLIPRVFLFISDVYNFNTIQFFNGRRTVGFLIFQIFLAFLEFPKLTYVWHGTLVYLLFLTFFSWISGNIFTETGVLGYLSLNGWSVGGATYLGVPDIIVVVIPHLCFVVIPSLLIMSGLAAEKVSSRIRYLKFSGKKHDGDRLHHYNNGKKIKKKRPHRIFRMFLMLLCLLVLSIHFRLCRIIWKSYERLGRCRVFSHGTVDLVISDGKPKFETREFDPPKKEKWLNKKRFKDKRMREKKKRKEANSRDPRCLRQKGKKKKPRFPNAEARLLYKIEKAKIKEGLLIEKLKRYSVPKLQGPMTKPDNLDGEERFFMKKMAQKRSNYVPIGRRGVFGGVILNMHLHWKKHETVKVICKPCKPGGQVHEFAREIARLSGGTPIQIIGDDTIIFYRGKNYVQPEVMSPIDTLSKKRALEKSKYEQSLETVRHFIQISEKELQLYYNHIALYGDLVAAPKVEKSKETNPSMDNPDLESDSSNDESNKEDFDSADIQEFDCEMAQTGDEFVETDDEELELDSEILKN